ncbi:hypothetical protein [Hymenobacter coccineus]|uniref:hypothetical protein n=1 Tax=Hymenobacter coccineus TaxID=1908235 RepID=UPI0013012B36|nr:hypothetical protein [Hymenobacter coccineus]
MNQLDDAYSAENYEFNPFSEEELAMIMGGGGDDQALHFLLSTMQEFDGTDQPL